MFSLIGILLAVLNIGFSRGPPIPCPLMTYNINLIWGIVLLVFGVLMLLGALKGGKKSAVGLIFKQLPIVYAPGSPSPRRKCCTWP